MSSVFDLTPRLLMGPGPSNVAPSVLQAMALPALGHLDPQFVSLMEEIKVMLRQVMLTSNELTIPVSGTGSAGMEAAVCNVVEPGDRVVVCVNGVFGGRMADVCGRYGAEVVKVEAPWGEPIDPAAVQAALAGGPTKLVGIVHAETSTGVLQPLEEISALTHDAGALLLVDCVTSLGGHPVKLDEWGIDVAYSGTQKCLSIPPGLAPLSLSPAAMSTLSARKSKVPNWYLDMSMVQNYWGQDRVYHHTAPVNALFGFHEGLRLVLEEGLENRWARHQANHELLVQGLADMGLTILPAPEYRLWSLNAVRIPEGVDDMAVRKQLLNDYNIEIGGGLGDLKGKVWRVGLMGCSSTPNNINALLGALQAIL
jgi:alanine-glyoxylate transaminase/serine-glyoxylate transaminase/serine-pyruvate transaminase